MRREILIRLEQRGAPLEGSWEEPEFFRHVMDLKRGVSAELVERLAQIDAYEGLCRLLDDAFRLVLYLSAVQGGAAVSEKAFANHELTSKLARNVKPSVRALISAFSGSDWEGEIVGLADRYQGISSATALYRTVLQHHEDAQRDKPPDGKRPWLENLGQPGVVARPQYYPETPPEGSDLYLHDYRTASASNFLKDLRRYSS
jgi:hypothetical protein